MSVQVCMYIYVIGLETDSGGLYRGMEKKLL